MIVCADDGDQCIQGGTCCWLSTLHYIHNFVLSDLASFVEEKFKLKNGLYFSKSKSCIIKRPDIYDNPYKNPDLRLTFIEVVHFWGFLRIVFGRSLSGFAGFITSNWSKIDWLDRILLWEVGSGHVMHLRVFYCRFYILGNRVNFIIGLLEYIFFFKRFVCSYVRL